MSVPSMPVPAGFAPPAPIAPVTTASGQTIEVLSDSERLYYKGQAARYQAENKFDNTSDLLELDRLVFMELLVFRASSWLGRGQDYGMTLPDRGGAACRRRPQSAATSSSKSAQMRYTWDLEIRLSHLGRGPRPRPSLIEASRRVGLHQHRVQRPVDPAAPLQPNHAMALSHL